jgi:hypothetical protein
MRASSAAVLSATASRHCAEGCAENVRARIMISDVRFAVAASVLLQEWNEES